MHITHYGGNEGVTGSCHQLHYNDNDSVLVDCGLFQGRDARRFPSAEIQFPLDGIQALVLTHVHIDHVGRIPYLLEAGFRKPIYCTPPTARFLPIMLEDSIRLGITRNKKVVAQILKEVKELIQPVPYGQWQALPRGASFRYSAAGHILGSAYVEFDHGPERFVFSGDIGSHCTPILREPVSPERADVLVLESTYGDRLHEGRATRMARLEAILCETMENRGVTIIPAFSLGRTQELLFELNKIMEGIDHRTNCSMLKAIDIIVDSPMAIKLTDIYEQMTEYWSEEANEVLTVDSQPFVFKNLIELDQAGESRGNIEYLKRSGRPAIVIAGSGMCTGGRVVEYLKTFISKPTTDIVFVGYQAYGTLGRQIQECHGGKCGVSIEREEFLVRAKTHTLTGYSAHADQNDLLRFVQGMKSPPKEIRLVHGEYQPRQVLAEKLNGLGIKTIACTNPDEQPPEVNRPRQEVDE